jgi:putative ATP-dependent endonuclease of the OLD family
MRLSKVIIENFRGYRHRTEVDVGNLTSIIGCNDVGKSSILEALAIFFECEGVKIDAQDINIHRRDELCSVSCVFESLPPVLVIDAQAETTLANEHLLNAEGKLEIVKKWECGAKTKCFVYAHAVHPTAEPAHELLQLKNAQLKAIAKERKLDVQGAGGAASNVALRTAIRESVGDLAPAPTLVPLSTEDGKRIWDALQVYLPTFALFRSDRASKDDDPEVADPMKVAVQEALKAVEGKLEEIREEVRARVIEVANRTVDKIREMDPTLAGQLSPSFKAEPKFDGFKLSLTGDEAIPINKRGSGVRRLILLNFFRAEVERKRAQAGSPGVIYAIEEPETSLHPDKQALLVGALSDLSEIPGTQVLLTTHSPGLAAQLPQASIRFVHRTDDNHPRVDAGEAVMERVSSALGVTPDPRPRPKVLLFVEGPHDVTFLQHVCRLLRQHDPSIVCIETDKRVAIVIAGGSTLKHWVDKQYLQRLGCNEVHIYDRDDAAAPTYKDHVAELNLRGPAVWARLTTKRTIENYLHPDAIKSALGLTLTFTDDCDVPRLVGAALGCNPSTAKKRLNDAAAKSMTIDQLRHVDPAGEVASWFAEVAARAA